MTTSNNSPDDSKAKNQTTLVYLLFALHILFGITGLIGVIICHTKKEVTEHTVFNSHRIWQIWTFWTGTVGYTAGFYYWITMGSINILILTFGWVYYRIASGWWKARKGNFVGLKPLSKT